MSSSEQPRQEYHLSPEEAEKLLGHGQKEKSTGTVEIRVDKDLVNPQLEQNSTPLDDKWYKTHVLKKTIWEYVHSMAAITVIGTSLSMHLPVEYCILTAGTLSVIQVVRIEKGHKNRVRDAEALKRDKSAGS